MRAGKTHKALYHQEETVKPGIRSALSIRSQGIKIAKEVKVYAFMKVDKPLTLHSAGGSPNKRT